jgi:hypothetical protein
MTCAIDDRPAYPVAGDALPHRAALERLGSDFPYEEFCDPVPGVASLERAVG